MYSFERTLIINELGRIATQNINKGANCDTNKYRNK